VAPAPPLQPAGIPGRAARLRRPTLDAVLALAAWAALIVAARALVLPLYHADHRVLIGNPPLVGRLDLRTTWRIVAGLALAAAAVIWGPRVATRLSWTRLLALTGIAAFVWAVALAASDGLAHVWQPLETRYEYLHDVPLVSRMPDFLHTFAPLAPLYDFHVHAHPPLMLLVFWAMSKLGLGGGVAAAIVVIAMGAAAAPAALVALRELASEEHARAAAPFLAFTPAAVYVATSPDAFYMGVFAIGVALFAVATGRQGDRVGDACAFGSGLVLGASLFLTYGVVTLGAIVLAIAVYRRALRPLLMAGGGVLAVVLAFLAGGFWWYDGLQAARELQLAGVYQRRPYAEFLVNSPAAFALVIGPAVAVGLARLRERGVWVITGVALLALLIADLSGYARGETERVWLPFAPWLLIATCALSPSLRARQGWLALQVATALALQVAAKGPW
jgi:hypothetical protein